LVVFFTYNGVCGKNISNLIKIFWKKIKVLGGKLYEFFFYENMNSKYYLPHIVLENPPSLFLERTDEFNNSFQKVSSAKCFTSHVNFMYFTFIVSFKTINVKFVLISIIQNCLIFFLYTLNAYKCAKMALASNTIAWIYLNVLGNRRAYRHQDESFNDPFVSAGICHKPLQTVCFKVSKFFINSSFEVSCLHEIILLIFEKRNWFIKSMT
jgi:hypothetical protein